VLACGAAQYGGEAWPLLLWPMYARTHPVPPERVAELEIRWTDSHGEEIIVLPGELFTQVHAGLGRRVVAEAVASTSDRDAYRGSIARRLRDAFGARLPAEIRVRKLWWNVAPRRVPAYRRCCPDGVEDAGVWLAGPEERHP
jgi:hypothetical protein